MKVKQHRNGDLSITLDKEEQGELWALLREGRRAHVKQYANYDGQFALTFMSVLSTEKVDVTEHISRFGN